MDNQETIDSFHAQQRELIHYLLVTQLRVLGLSDEKHKLLKGKMWTEIHLIVSHLFPQSLTVGQMPELIKVATNRFHEFQEEYEVYLDQNETLPLNLRPEIRFARTIRVRTSRRSSLSP